MKHIIPVIISIVFLISLSSIQAQSNISNDYVIISNGEVTDATPYTQALDAADWEPYRLQNQRYQLSFENGFTIQLKSAVELLNSGQALNIPSYRTENPTGYVPPVLELLPGNVVGMKIQTTNSKHY